MLASQYNRSSIFTLQKKQSFSMYSKIRVSNSRRCACYSMYSKNRDYNAVFEEILKKREIAEKDDC